MNQEMPYGADTDDFFQRYDDPNQHVTPEESQAIYQHFASQGHPDFQRAADGYFSQVDPNQFAQAAEQLPAPQREDLLQNLLGSLGQGGFDIAQIAPMLGLPGTNPQQFGLADIARLVGFAQQNAPGALQGAARQQPGIMDALGNPLVQNILGQMAARFLGGRR